MKGCVIVAANDGPATVAYVVQLLALLMVK